MTNLEKWRLYNRDLSSPDSFINISFYSMIASCLQRRVWVGPEEKPLFPNLYTILVAPPSLGKGLILGSVMDFLKFHKRKRRPIQDPTIIESNDPNNVLDQSFVDEMKRAIESINGMRNKRLEEPLLFPMGADSITYEELTNRHANSTCFNIVKPHKILAPRGRYIHCSITFLVEEIGNLFRRKQEDVVKYLLAAYDCRDYEYATKHQGKDIIKTPCLNLIGGTNPSFLHDSFEDKLIGEGFSARTIFDYEEVPRFRKFEISEFDEEQIQCKKDLLEHIRELSTLFGQVTYTEEAHKFFKDYWEDSNFDKKKVNRNPLLVPYYGRKNITMQKLAMAIHFSETKDSFVISLEECKQAIKILDALEKNMHLALHYEGDSKFAKTCQRISTWLNVVGEKSLSEIWKQFIIPAEDLEQALNYLVHTGRIEEVPKEGKRYYKGKNSE